MEQFKNKMLDSEEKDNLEIVDIKQNKDFLEEYILLCNEQWSNIRRNEEELKEYVKEKINKILYEDKVISILGLVNENDLIGFISLLKYEKNRTDLTPWYATMYVKKEYRGLGYSKILNNAVLKEAKNKGYNKIYLKTDLNNYYEKFGATFIEYLNNNEKLYYIDLENV